MPVTSAPYSSLVPNLDLHSKPEGLTAPPHTPHTQEGGRDRGRVLCRESFAFLASSLSERTDRTYSTFYLIKWMSDFCFFFVCLLECWFHMSLFCVWVGGSACVQRSEDNLLEQKLFTLRAIGSWWVPKLEVSVFFKYAAPERPSMLPKMVPEYLKRKRGRT